MESGRSLRMHNVCRCATRSGSTTWRQDRSRWTNMSTAWAIWDRSEHQHLSWFVIIFHLEFHFLAGHPQILVVKWTHFCGKTGWLGDLHRRFRNDWKWYPINTLWGFINLGFTWQKVCFTMEIMIRVAKHWTATPNKPMRVTAIFRPRHLERYCAAAFLRCMAHPQQKTTPDQRVTRNADVLYVF